MFTRKMRPEERDRLNLIQAVAFEFPYEPPKPEEESEPDPMTWWFSGENETPYGCIGVLPEDVRFDGSVVSMGGIGGVATLPMYRRSGVIRACMNAALKDMYENGYVFSSLYPFSRAYYRQFGFEDGASVSTWTVPFSAFELPDVGGTVEMIMPGADFAPVREVYAAASANWNLSAISSNILVSWEKANRLKECRYLYIWRDDAGCPAGAIMFSKKDGVMDCTTSFPLKNGLLFRDVRALIGLLRFAKGFAADYSAIRFTVPQNVCIQNVIREGNDAKCEVGYNGMARLINVKRALELCACRGEGSVTIAVTDGMIPENNAAWKVQFAAEGENCVAQTDEAPDLEMPVGELTQLLLGYRTAEDIPMMPRVRVHAKRPLEKIFFAKKCHIFDLF